MATRKSISDSKKMALLRKTAFTCANSPESNYPSLENTHCPCWKNTQGRMGEDFQIDHREALQFGGSDEDDNLFPLCTYCHAYKTHNERKTASNYVRDYRTMRRERNTYKSKLVRLEAEFAKTRSQLEQTQATNQAMVDSMNRYFHDLDTILS